MRRNLTRYLGIVGIVAATLQVTGSVGSAQHVSVDGVAGRTEASASLFSSPAALAFDVKRNVYVADSGQQQVIKLSPLAHELKAWGKRGAGSGTLGQPTGITADALGHVYVSDTQRSRVDQYGYSGKLLGKWAGHQFAAPASLAIDAGGNLYVADSGHNRIAVLSSKGKITASWNGANGLPVRTVTKKGKRVKARKTLSIGRLARPQGVFVDYLGHIFIADTGNNRIVELSSTGVPQHAWGTSGSGTGQFNRPVSIAVDLHNNMWVSDAGNDRVVELSSSGKTESVLGGATGSGVGQFNGPRGLAVDGRGNLYVADSGNGRIEKFSASSHQAIAVWK